MTHKIRAILVGPLPVDNAVVKHALETAFGEIQVTSAQSYSNTEPAEVVVAAFPAANTIDKTLADMNHHIPGAFLIGLGAGVLENGEAIDESEWTATNLSRAFRAARQMHELRTENRRLKGDLLTTARRLSHDLRSPLGCIHTNGDMIKELGSAALDDATLRESAGLILDSAKEATALINRVSLVLRASTETPKLEPVDSGATLKEALASLKATTPALSLPKTWPRVLAVPPWLIAIWTNLLDNAVRHGGPEVKIDVSWREISAIVHFSVTDNGPGVPNQQVPALFRPFERLHASQSGGLGLSIVHRFVTRMGGTCAYVQPPEGGACFTFSLSSAA
ncbi:MAG: HAMP domain-containing sensor histidine kinase [Nibricoccus sp.]